MKDFNEDKKRHIFSKFSFFPPTKMDKCTEEFVKELLFISWTDLIAANVLYKNKLYAQAIYYLQQCQEKLVKAEYLRDGTIKKHDLISIRHNTIRAFHINELISLLWDGVL